jgi:ABC-type amino acid transport substrate-binding protein
VRHYRNTSLAVEELKKGTLAAVVGLRSELMAGALDRNGFDMTDIPAPGVPASGWALGVAVRKDYDALARAVDEAMGQLIRSGQIEAIFRKHRVDWLQP